MELKKDGDVVPWNSIIAGYTLRGDSAAAVVLFEKMQGQGIHPNDITYSWALKAYANEGDFAEAYVQVGKALPALELLEKMQLHEIIPDNFTFSCIMKACSDIKDKESGRLIHDQMLKSEYECDIVTGNALVDMYSKFGIMEESYCVFQRLTSRDVVTWNAIIIGCAQQENFLLALELFQKMQEGSIQPDESTYTCMLKVCSSIGASREGRWVHDQVMKRGLESCVNIKNQLVEMYIQWVGLQEGSKTLGTVQMKNWIPWNAMIIGHAQHGSGLAVFEWFLNMRREGIPAEKSTYLAVLKACANVGATVQGMFVHDQIIRCGYEIDIIVGSTLVDIYAKCGNIKEARTLFYKLPNRDVVSWNAMISGYTRHGDYSQAKNCLEEMREHGLKPDDRTYSSVLAVCSRLGKAEEGHKYLRSMKESYGVSPDSTHFTCMIDLLSRAGQLDQAEVLLKSLPCLPDVHGWRALLSACRAHGDKDLGKRCYYQAVLSNPENSSGYVLMSNICADAGMLEDAQEIQGQRVLAGAWKMPGKSWIEIKRSIYEFTVGEKALPQGGNVLVKLKNLNREMVSEGHVPQVSLVLGEGRITLHASVQPQP